VTLDTDYPEVWYGLLEEYIGGMVSISNQSKKIYITTSVPYLKLPNQTASGPLYAGMISCTVEDPDGGGGGGDGGGGDDVGDYNGTGDGIMSSGSQWWNIPSSENMTKMDIALIVYDLSGSLANDFIQVTVNDEEGNWWKLIIELEQNDDRINKIYAKSGTAETTSDTSTYKDMPLYFPLSYPIDLLSTSNYDIADGCYQNAGIKQPNCLVTYLGDDAGFKQRALIYYAFTVDD